MSIEEKFEETEDYLSPPRLYAIRFSEEDYVKGSYILYTRAEGIALPGMYF